MCAKCTEDALVYKQTIRNTLPPTGATTSATRAKCKELLSDARQGWSRRLCDVVLDALLASGDIYVLGDNLYAGLVATTPSRMPSGSSRAAAATSTPAPGSLTESTSRQRRGQQTPAYSRTAGVRDRAVTHAAAAAAPAAAAAADAGSSAAMSVRIDGGPTAGPASAAEPAACSYRPERVLQQQQGRQLPLMDEASENGLPLRVPLRARRKSRHRRDRRHLGRCGRRHGRCCQALRGQQYT
eukprot:m.410422 g.410422  ORF g.410422 m.410422 type:complete len:241 (-) comp20158_c7_seq7:36-758(-)